jgi:ABC-type phosphate transport system substrate-binding protein
LSAIRNLFVAGAVGALLCGITATASLADPPKGVAPRHTDIVGVGSDATQHLTDRFTVNYDSSHPKATRKWYSWDAVGSTTITEKKGCGSRNRPAGTTDGLAELEANLRPNGDSTDFCVDYARSARARASTDPNTILFLPFGIDGVTWSADKLTGVTHANQSLSTKQLRAIYSCDASILSAGDSGPVTWKELGGTSANQVIPVIPLSASAVGKFFLQEIGVTTLGTCVQGQDNSVEQSEGTNPIFQNPATAPDIVFPYSIADYLAQSQNGHNSGEQGSMVLRSVGTHSPTTGKTAHKEINTGFPYVHEVYNVVRNVAANPSARHVVPKYLRSIFGNGTAGSGWVCSNSVATADIASYGFRPLPESTCGATQ